MLSNHRLPSRKALCLFTSRVLQLSSPSIDEVKSIYDDFRGGEKEGKSTTKQY